MSVGRCRGGGWGGGRWKEGGWGGDSGGGVREGGMGGGPGVLCGGRVEWEKFFAKTATFVRSCFSDNFLLHLEQRGLLV